MPGLEAQTHHRKGMGSPLRADQVMAVREKEQNPEMATGRGSLSLNS